MLEPKKKNQETEHANMISLSDAQEIMTREVEVFQEQLCKVVTPIGWSAISNGPAKPSSNDNSDG